MDQIALLYLAMGGSKVLPPLDPKQEYKSQVMSALGTMLTEMSEEGLATAAAAAARFQTPAKPKRSDGELLDFYIQQLITNPRKSAVVTFDHHVGSQMVTVVQQTPSIIAQREFSGKPLVFTVSTPSRLDDIDEEKGEDEDSVPTPVFRGFSQTPFDPRAGLLPGSDQRSGASAGASTGTSEQPRKLKRKNDVLPPFTPGDQ
jgi:hypothetical protein